MIRLYISSLLQIIRRKEDVFWGLIFPVALATLFYATFGSGIDLEKMETIPTALVSEGNSLFENFIQDMDGNMLSVAMMDEEEALEALMNDEIKGIFYSSGDPSLIVASSNMRENILETILSSYIENQSMMMDIATHHPGNLPAAIAGISSYSNFLESVTVGGESMETNLGYFYALIGMACLFGAFIGVTSAVGMRADQSALALRRSITPVNRLALVISEMLAAFTIQFANVCILLFYLRILGISFGEKWMLLLPVCILGSMTGVAFGIFVGSLKFREGYKIGILVSGSLLMSFLAGLMFANMKDIVEHHFPIINRINPASLIADAFYSISIYDNPARYRMNLILLAMITVAFVTASFLQLRRERYESL